MRSPTKPRLKLRRYFGEWGWWGLMWWGLLADDDYIYIGSARYLTVEDAVHIYRSAC